MAADDLTIRIGAKADQFRAELKKIKKSTAGLEKSLAKTAKISAAAFVGLAAAAGLAVKSFAKFESGFTNVQTLLDKSSFKTKSFTKGIADMKDGLLELGAASGESFEVLNEALFDTVSAGIDAEESIAFLAAATNLAIAGATDTSVAVNGMTSAMNAFGIEADQAIEVSQKFFVAQKAGKTTVAELAQGFGKAGATAAAYGVSLDELLASVSAVTLGGVKTSAAYTGFNAALVSISKPTADAAAEAKRLGIEFNTTALRTQGLEGFLKTLTSANGFTQKSVERLFGSVEAQKVIFALTGAQADAFSKQIVDLADKQKLAATFTAALEVKQKTTEQSMKRLKSASGAVAITIGEQLAPTVNNLATTLTDLVKRFNDLDKEQVQSIVTAAKWVGSILAGIASATAFALAAIKVSAIIASLTAAFGPAALGASALWVALTGPIGIAVAGIAAVAAGAYALFRVFKEPEPAKGIQEINKELDKLKEKEKKLANAAHINRLGQKNLSQIRLEKIQEEIKELEKLKKAGIEATKDFGTGELLLEPKIKDAGGNPVDDIVDGILNGKDAIEIPIRPVPTEGEEGFIGPIQGPDVIAGAAPDEVEDKAADQEAKKLEAARLSEMERVALAKEATDKRIEIARTENQQLLEINKAKSDGLSQQEIDFLMQRQSLDEEFKAAQGISDKTERDLALENLRIKNQTLLAEEMAFNEAKVEQDAINREEKAVLDEELQALSDEQRAALNEEDLKSLQAHVLTKQEVENQEANTKLKTQINERNQFKKDELKFGTEVAEAKKFFNSQEVQGVKSTAGQLAALSQSKNSKLKAIGKAAASVNAAIATSEGAIKAYTSLAGIPIVGPALGAAAAGALIVFGVEQQANIARMQRGGIVPNGQGGLRDRVPALLQPGELVVPSGITPDFLQANGRPEVDSETGTGGGIERVEIGFTDNAFEIIERKREEEVALGIREA